MWLIRNDCICLEGQADKPRGIRFVRKRPQGLKSLSFAVTDLQCTVPSACFTLLVVSSCLESGDLHMDTRRSRGQMPALLFPTPSALLQEPAFPSSSLCLSSSHHAAAQRHPSLASPSSCSRCSPSSTWSPWQAAGCRPVRSGASTAWNLLLKPDALALEQVIIASSSSDLLKADTDDYGFSAAMVPSALGTRERHAVVLHEWMRLAMAVAALVLTTLSSSIACLSRTSTHACMAGVLFPRLYNSKH